MTPDQHNDFLIEGKKDFTDAVKSKTADNNNTLRPRHEILAELKSLGVNTEELGSLSIEGLVNLLDGFRVLMAAREQHRKPGRPRRNPDEIPVLSKSDKIILHQLFSSQGRISSLKLSRDLDIPLSTIQRRRKRLQDSLVETRYLLRMEKLGWRSATLLVSTTNKTAESVGKQVLEMSDLVSSVTRAMGGSNFDLRIEVIFKTTPDLIALIDKIKSMEGISGLIWTESLNLIGRKETSDKIIDSS